MLRTCLAIAAIAALTLAATSSRAYAIDKPESVEVEGKIKWVYDYDDAKRLSDETGKPMFVVFRCER